MARKKLDTVKPIEITIERDKPMASSLQVAKHFGKSHDNVLRDIRALIADTPKEWGSINFEDMLIKVKIGNGAIRKDPAFIMTRDGFVILSMGFTGKQALHWKLQYIEAFNKMERTLIEQRVKPQPSIQRPTSESNDQREIRRTKIILGWVAFWAYVDKLDLNVAENILCAHLGVAIITDLANKQFNDALAFLERVSYANTSRSGPPVTARQKEIISRLLDMAAQFPLTRDQECFELHPSVEIRSDSFTELTEAGAEKAVFTLWETVCRCYQHSLTTYYCIGKLQKSESDNDLCTVEQ